MGASSSIKRKSYSDDCIDNQLTSIGKIMTSIRFMMIVMIMIMMIGMMIQGIMMIKYDHDDRDDVTHYDHHDDNEEIMLKILMMMISLRYHCYKDHIILTLPTIHRTVVSHQLLPSTHNYIYHRRIN